MSDLIFNLRILTTHFQINRKGKLKVVKNTYWKGKLRWYNLVWFH